MTSPLAVKVDYISFRESGQFSKRDVAYAERDPDLRPFMAYTPDIQAFAKTIEQRKKVKADRKTLVEVLNDQYKNYGLKPPAELESLLQEDTFTVTTAHQASLFLGPLYYVYKILSAVALSQKLAEVYPEYSFVPTFVLGAEDHDLDEIDHLTVGGETVRWKTQQTGATGDMSLEDIGPALEAVTGKLDRSANAQYLKQLLEKCYKPSRTLGVATAHFVAELFKEYGVVVANLNDKRLKQNYAPFIKREVLEQTSRELILATVEDLEKVGYSQQAHAREINFFYLQPGRRDRLVVENGQVSVLDTDISWTSDELREEVDTHPERFSPNVVMRPLLQELSLPNLAYVGGGGELAYWLERKTQFEEFGLPFPVLVRRDSAWWVDQRNAKQLNKLGLQPKELLGDLHQLLANYVSEKTPTEVNLSPDRALIQARYEDISARAAQIDPTLEKRVLAKAKDIEKDLIALEKRLIRTLKKQQADAVGRIEAVHESLLPGRGLQERKDSFIDLYVMHGKGFFNTLLENFDPLDMRLKVFVEELPG